VANSLSEIVRYVDRFIDASRRFFIVAERWNNGTTTVPMNGVDWPEMRKFEATELQVTLRSLERAVDQFVVACEPMESTIPIQWQTVLRSSASLGKHACNDARERGWFDGQHGVVAGASPTFALRKAVQWLSFLSDIMTMQGLSHSVREVLAVILENGPTRGPELAKLATGADDQNSTFREMLAGLVNDGLLFAGSGRHSTGYRLSDRGMQLAQLSGQLTDF